ncbi:MAG: class I SAM-dependent methyltransferase [Candidatus Azambacteria bacterium]|nr:class I SAM-dependent methyltransferase [Candidatus Azambacteria bacterium]
MDGQGFINIEKIVDQLDIKPNMVIADFGAGHGFFSIAFAKKVGSSGQVFAIDILQSALEAIRSQAKLEGLFNIKLIRGDLEKINGSLLPNESCDIVFIANLLFQVPDKLGLINEAYRVLKKEGELAVIEWKPYIALGPKKEHRLSNEELKQLVISGRFSELKSIDAGSHHNGFIFKK